jgi:hypothetical protein
LPSPWILINLIGSKAKIYARPGFEELFTKKSLKPFTKI